MRLWVKIVGHKAVGCIFGTRLRQIDTWNFFVMWLTGIHGLISWVICKIVGLCCASFLLNQRILVVLVDRKRIGSLGRSSALAPIYRSNLCSVVVLLNVKTSAFKFWLLVGRKLLIVIHLLCWIDQINKVIAVAIFLCQRLRVALFEVSPFQFILFIHILRVAVIIVLGALLGVDIGIAQN